MNNLEKINWIAGKEITIEFAEDIGILNKGSVQFLLGPVPRACKELLELKENMIKKYQFNFKKFTIVVPYE